MTLGTPLTNEVLSFFLIRSLVTHLIRSPVEHSANPFTRLPLHPPVPLSSFAVYKRAAIQYVNPRHLRAAIPRPSSREHNFLNHFRHV